MVIGKKFWPILATDTAVSYEPRMNPGYMFAANIVNSSSSISVKNVGPEIVSIINNMLSTSKQGVGLYGPRIPQNTRIVSCENDEIIINTRIEGIIDQSSKEKILVWNMDYPCSKAGDGPIQALLCIDSTHGDMAFMDTSGRTVEIPAGTLVKGAIYYFQISSFIKVGAEEFIGFSGN